MFHQFTIPTHPISLIENEIARDCYGLTKSEAVRLIRDHDLIVRILQEDKNEYAVNNKTYHSYRLNLVIRKNKVVGVSIG